MGALTLNSRAMKRRGLTLDNAEYRVYRCTQCGRIALYDEERMMLYYDAKNLGMVCLYDIVGQEPFRCPTCRSEDSFDEVPNVTEEDVRDTEWSFIIL